MPRKQITIAFTPAEINHLLCLLENNQREGWYFGNRGLYWKRHYRLYFALAKEEAAHDPFLAP